MNSANYEVVGPDGIVHTSSGKGPLETLDHAQRFAAFLSSSGERYRAYPINTGPRDLDVTDDQVVSTLTRKGAPTDWNLPLNCLGVQEWRSIIQGSGTRLTEKIVDLFQSAKLRWQEISFLSLYKATAHCPMMGLARDELGQVRAIQSSAFQVIAGATVAQAVRDGYENVHAIADQLVDPFQSTAKTETIPAILTEQSMQEVREGGPYLEGSATEEFFTIDSRKQGRLLSLSREMVKRDQTGMFLRRANRLGTKAAQTIEKLILERISDVDTKVYKPQGVAEALYSTTGRPRGTNKVAANGLVDITNLDNARAKLAAMTDNEGDPINVRPAILLVPDALVNTASKILNSEFVPGVVNENNPWGPQGTWRPKLLSSPVLDKIGTPPGTSTWYLGDFAQQFWKKVAFGIETEMQGRDSDAFLTHDVIMRFRVAFDIEVGAVDYVYVVQSVA